MPEDISDLVRHAGFIFAGTVQRVSRSMVEPTPFHAAAVVQVKSVIDAPPILHNWIGRHVTIGLRIPEDLKAGDSAIFFAGSWVYGASLALRELGHRSLPHDIRQVRRQVLEARERLADEDRRHRVSGAARIVLGRGAQIGEVAARKCTGPEREHDPRWLEALLDEELVLRGERGTGSWVLFAGSRDIAWREAPKLQVGQRGLWILHKKQVGDPAHEALVLDDPRDLRTPDELMRVQALLHDIV